ncbi:MAG: glycosyltransferase [Sphingobacteriaceae bacterium]|nr:glycosyltransferase [Sphingobacteriaceae bacterium]
MDPKIAVLIVSYNRKEFVLKNIVAVNRSTYKNISIIVFDNGSTDGTLESVSSQYPDVTLIRSKENLGGAGGFSKALDYAYDNNFDYMFCLDDDGAPKEDCLEILFNEHNKHDKATILGPKILPSDAKDESSKHFWPINGKYDSLTKKISEFSTEEKQRLISEEATYETASVALLGMFMHRSVIKINGLPDKGLFITNDDVEFCLRAWTNNIRICLVQKAVVYHPQGKNIQLSFFNRKMDFNVLPPWKLYYYIRNSIYITRIYFKFGQLLKTLMISFIIIFHHLTHEKQKLSILKNGIMGVMQGLIKKNEVKL